MTERQRLLYPGDPIADIESFRTLRDDFSIPTTASPEAQSGWKHGDLVRDLLAHTAINSTAAEVVGTAIAPAFSKELDYAKRSATIHMPESNYAVPEWAAHFGSVVLEILEHEHATNPRADKQIAQIRFRQYKGQPRNTHPHLDMVGHNVRNFHFYLAVDQSPATTYDGEFAYEPHPYEGVHEDPLEFFKDLDRQFGSQINERHITAHTAQPLDIMALSALTVHKPPEIMPIGRTLFGVQFYELADPEHEQ